MSSRSSPYPSILDYVRVVRANRLLIAVVTLVCAGVVLGLSLAQAPTYSSMAALAVRDESQDLALLGTTVAPQDPAVLAAEHAAVVLRQPVVLAASNALHLSQARIRGAVSVSVDPTTDFVDVTASARTAVLAARIANEVASRDATYSTQALRSRLTREAARLAKNSAPASGGGSGAATGRAVTTPSRNAQPSLNAQRTSDLVALSSLVTPVAVQATAPVPSSPSSPKPLRDTLIGAVIGLILGVLISFLRSAVDRRLVDADEISDAMRLPLIGHVHADTLGLGRAGENGHARFDGQDMETFRMLRQSVDYLTEEHASRTLVTSSTPSEGKSTVALGLALVNAAAGKRTLLVECDLRRPVLASRLGLRTGPGLAQYLTGQAEPPEILQTFRISSVFDAPADDARNITCIVAGENATEPAELLGSERFAEFITEVADVYEVVIVDSTPLLSVVDALELATHCDRLLMCVRAHQTTRQEAIAGGIALRRAPTKPTAVVITGISKHDAGNYGYYSYAGLYTDTAASPNGTPTTPIPSET